MQELLNVQKFICVFISGGISTIFLAVVVIIGIHPGNERPAGGFSVRMRVNCVFFNEVAVCNIIASFHLLRVVSAGGTVTPFGKTCLSLCKKGRLILYEFEDSSKLGFLLENT